ncbi:MAG: radical SAM protein [Sedimentisphaerales bacterium]
MYGDLRKSFAAIEPPVWAALLAAVVRQKGFSVKIIDAEAENYSDSHIIKQIAEYAPGLVVIGAVGSNPSASSTPKMVPAGRLLNAIKNSLPNTRTALYGIHPSALAKETLNQEKVDFVFKGECFYTIVKLLEELNSEAEKKNYDIEGLWYKKNGIVAENGWGKLVEDIDQLPFAAWDMLPMNKYRAHNWHCFENLNERQPYAVLYTSFGCPYSCRFCNIKANYNGKSGIRFRSPEKVVKEIDFLVNKYKVRNIKFADEIFVLKESRVIKICDLLIQRGYDLNIWAYTRIDTINERLLKKMKEAGITWLAFGIESASSKVRDGVIKGKFGPDMIRRAIKMTHNAGIHIVANFILGLPEDNVQTMQETLDMAKELNCEYTNFYTTMAYPGSQLYEDMVQQGIDLPANWLSYAQFSEETLPLSTNYLSSSDILRFRDRAFEEYHSSSGYLRMMDEEFGSNVVEHIKNMLSYKINRKYT